jgi:hypothetical protein
MHIEEHSELDAARTRAHIFYAFSFSLIHFVATVIVGGPKLSVEYRFMLLIFAGVVLFCRPQKRPVLLYILPPTLWALFVPPTLVPIALLPTLWLAAALLLLYLAWRFRAHYVSVTLKTGWARIKKTRVRRRAAIPAFVDAVHSFLSYGRGGVYAPGLKHSAAGSSQYRLRLAAFVLLIVFHACITTFYQLTPVEIIISQPGGYHLLFGMLVFAHLLPFVLVFAACFVISFPWLGKCYAVKLTENAPGRFAECFPELIQTLIKKNGVNK